MNRSYIDVNWRISLLLLLSVFLSFSVKSQIYNWCDDGYITGGGISQNIDMSGIDLEITGLVDEYCSILYDTSIIITGINDLNSNGIQHQYKFKFSEQVDLEFTLKDVNYGNGWNDKLTFSKVPIVMYLSGVTVNGAEVSPAQGIWASDGILRVRFENIDSLEILHGLGAGDDPGYVCITELVINDNFLHASEEIEQSYEIITVDNGVLLRGVTMNVLDITIYDISGKNIGFTSYHNGDGIQINSSDLKAGIYLLTFEDKGKYYSKKFVIN